MRPSGAQAAPETAGQDAQQPKTIPRLQAIRADGRHRSAVINGKVVRVGEEVDGAKVTAISTTSVVVIVEGKSSVLKLVGQDIKHAARATH
jgi:MSHA biogenesis protein MshK